MSTFKHMDAVYCPKLSTKPFLIFCKEGVNGVFLRYRNEEHWFTTGGVPSGRDSRSIPDIFLATEENKSLLRTLYDLDFEDDNRYNIYAVNELNFDGSVSKHWLYNFRGRYYTQDIGSYNHSVKSFKELGIYMSVLPEDMSEALKLNSRCKVISMGVDSIWNWAN